MSGGERWSKVAARAVVDPGLTPTQVRILAAIGIFAVILFLTYYFQRGIGFSPVRTGIAFLPLPLAIVVIAENCQLLNTYL